MCSVSSCCEKCGGAAEPAACMISFEYLGQTVRCLRLVSSCVVCGHRWEDEVYERENEQFMQRACASVMGRLETSQQQLGDALQPTYHRG